MSEPTYEFAFDLTYTKKQIESIVAYARRVCPNAKIEVDVRGTHVAILADGKIIDAYELKFVGMVPTDAVQPARLVRVSIAASPLFANRSTEDRLRRLESKMTEVLPDLT